MSHISNESSHSPQCDYVVYSNTLQIIINKSNKKMEIISVNKQTFLSHSCSDSYFRVQNVDTNVATLYQRLD